MPQQISGVVSYSGKQPQNMRVIAVTNGASWATNFSTRINSPTNYKIDVATGVTNWYVRAFRDLNGNGTNDTFEAQGEFAGNPVQVTNQLTTNVNITLTESDTDSDGLPDWWEWQYFGNITNANPTTDAEPDQFTNLQEYQAGSDPLADTDSDGLPDWWEVQYGFNPPGFKHRSAFWLVVESNHPRHRFFGSCRLKLSGACTNGHRTISCPG